MPLITRSASPACKDPISEEKAIGEMVKVKPSFWERDLRISMSSPS